MPHQLFRQKSSGIGQTQGHWTFSKYPSEAIHLSSQTAIRLHVMLSDADVAGVTLTEASGVCEGFICGRKKLYRDNILFLHN